MIRQLKIGELAPVLAKLVAMQGNCCAVCKERFTNWDTPVLDHDHTTGFIRGALHNSCNGTEGRLKAVAQRGHKGVSSPDYIIGLGSYLAQHKTPQTQLIHPSHKSADQKRLLKNKKARDARARKKA